MTLLFLILILLLTTLEVVALGISDKIIALTPDKLNSFLLTLKLLQEESIIA